MDLIAGLVSPSHKYDAVCKVSVDTHIVQGCIYDGDLDGLELVE